MPTTAKEKVLLGEAGEHLVLSRLMRHGHVASQAPRAWRADDILVEGGAKVQVKSSVKGPKAGWVVSDARPSPARVFAFVDFSGAHDEAVVYVVPSEVVHQACQADAEAYRRRNPTWNDNGLRKLRDPLWPDPEVHKHFPPGWLEAYKEAWHLVPDGSAS